MEEFVNTNIFFWIFWGIATVFGILIGMILRSATLGKSNREEFEMREQERLHLAAVNAQLRESNDLREADLKKIGFEVEELRARVAAFDQEKSLQSAAVQSAAARLQNAQTESAGYAAKIQVFEEQVLGLRTRNAYLTGEINRLREEINAWKNLHMDFAALQKNIAALEEAVAQLENERNLLRHEIDAIYFENENLQTELAQARPFSANGHGESAGHARFAAAPELEAAPVVDDLKIINGITPFAEQKLLELGIHTFSQIAEWDAAEVESMNEALGFFPGRIQREDWIGQARHLCGVAVA